MATTEITASRWKTFLLFALGLVFVAIALWALLDPTRSEFNHSRFGALFGLVAVVFGWLLLRPHRLLLDDEGYTLVGGLIRSPKKIYWRDVDKFLIYRGPWGVKMIGLNFKPGAGRVKLGWLLGADGALPKSWSESPEKVVEKLNAYRLRAASNANVMALPSA